MLRVNNNGDGVSLPQSLFADNGSNVFDARKNEASVRSDYKVLASARALK